MGTISLRMDVDGAFAEKVVTLEDNVSVPLDASLGNIYTLSATGNRTIAAPTNPTDGQKIVIEHFASGGPRTLSLTTDSAGGFRFGSDITGLSTTTGESTDYITCIYRRHGDRWDVIAYAKGYSDLVTEIFTSSTTWTVPAGVTEVNLQLWGAGGGGGAESGGGGSGGGAGAYVVESSHAVVPATNISIVIGQGGIGGVAGSMAGTGGPGYANGGDGAIANSGAGGGGGGSTSFDTLIASGGGGGPGSSANANPAQGATGSSGGAGATADNSKGGGGGGAAATAGGSASGSTGGMGGTGGTTQTGISGDGSPNNGQGAGSSAGMSGDGNSAPLDGSGAAGSAELQEVLRKLEQEVMGQMERMVIQAAVVAREPHQEEMVGLLEAGAPAPLPEVPGRVVTDSLSYRTYLLNLLHCDYCAVSTYRF